MTDESQNAALRDACKAVNGSSKLAELLTDRCKRTVSKASISRWKKERVPAEVCPDIEDLTGVPCEALRPDVNWHLLRSKKRKATSAAQEA